MIEDPSEIENHSKIVSENEFIITCYFTLRTCKHAP